MDARRAAAAVLRGLAFRQGVGDRGPAGVEPAGQAAISPSFCLAKASQPFSSLVAVALLVQVDGAVQERAGGPDQEPLGAEPRGRLLQQGEGPLQVGPPDVAAVDHAQRQHALRRDQLEGLVQLLRRADQVEVDGRHRQPHRGARLSRSPPK